jgi:hypothetical protein
MNIETHEVTFADVEAILSAFDWTEEVKAEFLRTIVFSCPIYLSRFDGQVLSLTGLIPPTLLSDTAYLWFVNTPDLEAHKVAIGRAAKRLVARMRSIYPRIVGHCLDDSSKRWLTTLGAGFIRQDGPHSFFEIIT